MYYIHNLLGRDNLEEKAVQILKRRLYYMFTERCYAKAFILFKMKFYNHFEKRFKNKFKKFVSSKLRIFMYKNLKFMNKISKDWSNMMVIKFFKKYFNYNSFAKKCYKLFRKKYSTLFYNNKF